MTIKWQPWRRWMDKKTGTLKWYAPPWIRKQYREHLKGMHELEESLYGLDREGDAGQESIE